MTWLEITVSLSAFIAIIGMFCMMARYAPAVWTHHCARYDGEEIDVLDGDRCPWCGEGQK